MNKLLFLILSFITICTISLKAQYDVQKGKELIKKSSAKYKAYNTLKAEFIFITESKIDKTKSTLNGFLYLKNGKFRIKLGEQIIISDLKTVWTYLKEVNEVQINNYDPENLEVNPKDIFTMWEKGYLYGYAGEVKIKDKIFDLVELTPEDKSKSYFKVKLFFNKKTTHIQIVKIFEKSGTINTFKIKAIYPNIKLSDNLFTFDKSKYPGVEIIDLRD